MAADKDNRSGDFLWAVIAAVLFGVPTIILSGAAAGWDSATSWLLDHQVLVPSSADPALTIPETAGAGLDETRIALVLGVLVIVLLAIRLLAGLILASMARRMPAGRRDPPVG